MAVSGLSTIVDFSILIMVIIGIAGVARLLEENRKLMAISISILTLVAIYATAYLYYTYYHVSSPLIDAIVDWWYVVLIVILIILLVWLWPKVLPKKSQGTVVFH